MPSALPDLIDRLIDLMENNYSSAELSMPSNRFKHSDVPIEYLLSNSAQRPYPFEVKDSGEFQPLNAPATLASINRWHGVHLEVRVVYALSPHDQKEQIEDIQEDRYQIRRVLGEPDNWDAVTGFSGVEIGDDSGPESEDVPGMEEDLDVIYILTIPVDLIYREDHTT